MRISGFMHGITHPGLIKRLYERIPRSMDEMYRMTTSFLQGEVAALSHGQRKTPSWKTVEEGNKPNFKKGFKNKTKTDRKPDRFSKNLFSTKNSKRIYALEKEKFKAPPNGKQTVEKILPSTHGHCNNKSTNKATVVKFGNIWKNAEVEVRAGRIRHPIQTKDRNQSTLLADFFYRGTTGRCIRMKLWQNRRLRRDMGRCSQRLVLHRRLRGRNFPSNKYRDVEYKEGGRPEQDRIHTLRAILTTGDSCEELKGTVLLNEEEILDIVEEEGNTWMTPIQEYLTKEILPEDKKKARAVRRKAANMHSGPRSVVAKVIQTGYYWPTMHMDARNLIKECNDCQIHRPVPRNPQQNLTPITSPWPFYKWGIDIAGPSRNGTGCGLPGEIISSQWKAVRDKPFKDWCEKLCIRQCFASVKHPQANGLVERANRSLGEGIKARLEEKSKDWIEELPHVLWAHRTMIKTSNGETPFSLTYGTEAVIPAEIGMPTLRTAEMDQAKNNEALGINLDLIEERREQAAIQEAKSKKKMEKYYNSRVRGTSFKPGEMVYRSNEASHAKDGGKLGPKWEGPYEVKESLGKGAYKLKDRKGNDMPRTWNICNLKKCYIHEM
ncbi:reverse transcriptase domain-containing protein [Tanacetum coccineum]